MSSMAVLMFTYRQSLPAFISDGLFGVLVISFVVIKLFFFLQGLSLCRRAQ